MDKKIDVKKLQFGSKIDKSSGDREKYYTVKRIIKPQLVELSNNLTEEADIDCKSTKSTRHKKYTAKIRPSRQKSL
ncbi:MAG: hypothetical protein LBT26_08580 [Clostridiales Family XIII bacterium]|nr:hypothetical protein [Clostridiales Family XIII bacterium]